MKKKSKIELPFPYRPKKRKKGKKKEWLVGYTGKNIGDFGVGFGNPLGGAGGGAEGGGGGADGGGDGGGGGGMGEAMEDKKDKFLYQYSCAMLNISENIAPIIKYWAKKMLPVDSLYINENEGIDGYEDIPHVTVKYGLHDIVPDRLEELVKGCGGIDLTFDLITKFTENPKFDVLKIDIKGDKLKKLNELISQNMVSTDKYDKYKPHVTLAYIKKGTCEEFVDNDFFSDLEDSVDQIYFNSRTGDEYFIKL